MLTRDEILAALESSLKPVDEVYALWEAGAAAFNRIDQWSDIDLMVDVRDDYVPQTLEIIEKTLSSLSPIVLKYVLPQPTWHGHHQVFYRLKDASPYLFIDAVVMQHSNPNKFLEEEQHGKAHIWFDKIGDVQPPPFNPQALQEKLHKRLQDMRVTFDLFQIETSKELNRGNDIEAFAFYYSSTLEPLVELLRIRYMDLPARHQFGTRYIQYDLPEEIVERLHPLFFVRDAADLAAKHQQAGEWFHQVLQELDEE